MNSQGGPIATRDRLQFAHELFDRHAEAVYHYVLAWTGEQASAVDLTTMVLRTAVARMDQLADGADPAELEMRVIALTRAAVTRWRGRRPGQRPVAAAVPEDSMALFDGLGELDDNQREVLTLSELLGKDPEHAGRLLGCDASAVEEQRREALESLWRAMNDAPPGQPVSTWDRLTVSTGLRRAAAGWFAPAGAVLAYLSEQLFGEAPVGVPATAPARGAAAKAPARGAGAKAPATGRPTGAPASTPAAPPGGAAQAPVPVPVAGGASPGSPNALLAAGAGGAGQAAMSPATAPATAGASGSGEPAGATNGAQRKVAAGQKRSDEDAGPQGWAAGLVPVLQGRWTAWGMAAAAAAVLGVVAALTIGGPVSGSSQCATRLACMPSTTVEPATGNGGEVIPAPTDASGNLMPTTTSGDGGVGRLPGFPLITGRSTTTGGQVPSTTRRGTATTSNPPPTTTPGPTSPRTTQTTARTTTTTTEPPTTTSTTTTILGLLGSPGH
jgi:DNA-directed RNA polymerase specialized sigma24 family protein